MLRECTNTSYGGGSGTPDNLGNHTATQDLNLAGFNLINVGLVTANSATGILVYDAGEVKVRDISTISGGGGSYSFSITDGVTPQTISNGDTLTFSASGDVVVQTSATDTVTIGFAETLTILTYNSGTHTLTYTDEAGTPNNITLVDNSGGSSFTCANLASCSVSGLSDVNYVSAPTNGQTLVWSNVYSAFIPTAPFTSFTISGGGTTQSIINGNTISFLASGDLSVAVSATDTVTYTFNETLTTLTYNSGTNTLTYTGENGSPSNITLANYSGGGGPETVTTLILDTSGAGTHADPITACNLKYTNESAAVSTIDNRSTIYFCQGQANLLVADDTMANQPRFIVPEGQTIELCKVYATLGVAGTSTTTLQVVILNENGAAAPTPGSPTSTLNLNAGEVFVEWAALAGTVLTSLQHLQSRVDIAGDDAQHLTIHYWGKTCLCS